MMRYAVLPLLLKIKMKISHLHVDSTPGVYPHETSGVSGAVSERVDYKGKKGVLLLVGATYSSATTYRLKTSDIWGSLC